MTKIFYNVEQAARKLELSRREVESKISSGELPVVSVGNRRVIPANAVDNLGKKGSSPAKAPSREGRPKTSRTAPQNRGKDYYTDTEVAQQLSKPYTEIYRMANLGALPVTFVDGRRMFPKQAIDHLAAQTANVGKRANQPDQTPEGASGTRGSRTPPRSPQSTTSEHSSSQFSESEYFTPEQLAYALQRPQKDVDRMIRWGEIKTVTVDGRRWVSREETEKIILRRQESRQERIRRRLPQPRLLRTYKESSLETGRTPVPQTTENEGTENRSVSEVSERVVVEAAQRIGTSINKVRQMVAEGKLILDPGSGRLAKAGQDLVDQTSKNDASEQRSVPSLDETGESSRPPETPTVIPQELKERIKTLQEEKTSLTEELKQEKAWHAKDLRDAQHEISQLEIQLDNLRDEQRRTTEKLSLDIENLELEAERLESELETERERREDAEYSTRSLQQLLKEEGELTGSSDTMDDKDLVQEAPESQMAVRGFLESLGKNVRDALNPEEAEDIPGHQELEELKNELKREKEARENDRLTAQYEYAQLENSRRDLDEQNRALESELEDDRSNKANIVRRIRALESKLAQSEAERRRLEVEARVLAEVRQLLGVAIDSPERTEAFGELRIHTQHGLWVFRPPFALEEDEIELIRLVAGEAEITAEQIKRRTGRRRAANDLDELLDRLHEASVEPIKKANDRYSFDPDFLQD